MIRQARPVTDRVGTLVQECKKLIEFRRRVTVLQSRHISTPTLVGIVRPVILLPKHIEQRLQTEEFKTVLIHELHHVRRHDVLVNLVTSLLAAVYWFHPAIWFFQWNHHRLRELACDEATVGSLAGVRRSYASGLVKVAEMVSNDRPIPAISFLERKGDMNARVMQILNSRMHAGRGLSVAGLTAILIIGLILLPGAARPGEVATEAVGALQDATPNQDAPPSRKQAEAQELSQVPRTIGQEPTYQTEAPKYCLAVFGPELETRVWLVQDGDTLYADLNGNGDLTDDGEKFAAEEVTGQRPGDHHFKLGDINERGLEHKRFSVWVENVDRLEDDYDSVAEMLRDDPEAMAFYVMVDYQQPGALGTGIGGRTIQATNYLDTNGVLQFGKSPADAPVIHFGGPWSIGQRTPQELIPGRDVEFYLELQTPGIGPGSTVRTGYELLVPEPLRPQLEITYPSVEPNGAPLVETYELSNRCCTFCFHGPIKAPENAAAGPATASFMLPGWGSFEVAATTGTIDISPSPAEVTLAPVSPGIQRELMHPNRDVNTSAIRFSPDGKKLIAGAYPDGTVMLWDVESGRQLTEIRALDGGRGTFDFFHVTPDWKQVWAAEENLPEREIERVERNGERQFDVTYGSYIRSWDLETGEVLRDYQHSPPRWIRGMELLDGKRFMSMYETEPGPLGSGYTSGTLWNIETGEHESLPEHGHSMSYRPLSADGSLIGMVVYNEDNLTESLQLLATSDLQPRVSIPIAEEYADYSIAQIINSGKTLLGTVRVYEEPADWSHWKNSIRWWDGETGEELGRFDYPEANDDLMVYAGSVSPDGKMFACPTWRSNQKRVYVFDMENRKLLRTVTVDEAGEGEQLVGQDVLFSGDGKWIVTATQHYSRGNRRAETPTAYDMPQARIHIIEAATGEIKKSLVAPQGYGTHLELSPDGKTLASSSLGRVLLWDMDEILEGIEE